MQESSLGRFHASLILILLASASFSQGTGFSFAANSRSHSQASSIEQPDTIIIRVLAGWNLLSIPLLLPDARVKTLFPTAISPAFAFEGAYVQREALSYGESYWLKFPADDSILVAGTKPMVESIPLRHGWNLIASPFKPTPVSNLYAFPDTITNSGYYSFIEGKYASVDTMHQGKGYWVKSSAQGNISPSKWELLGLREEMIFSLAHHPNNPSTLYAGSMSDFSEGIQGKLFKSEDGGITWDTLLAGGSFIDIVFDPIYPETMYVVSGTVLKSVDGGTTWEEIVNGIYLDPETFAQTLVVDPHNSNILYAGTTGFFGGGLFKSIDGGASWSDLTVANDTLGNGVISLAMDPSAPNVVFAGTAGGGFILKSTDSGINWSTTGLGYTGSLIDMIKIDPLNNQKIYTSVRFIGFFVTIDGGVSWNREVVDDSADGHLELIFNTGVSSERLLAGGWSSYYSPCSTCSWNEISQGLPHRYTARSVYSQTENKLYIGLLTTWFSIGGVYVRK